MSYMFLRPLCSGNRDLDSALVPKALSHSPTSFTNSTSGCSLSLSRGGEGTNHGPFTLSSQESNVIPEAMSLQGLLMNFHPGSISTTCP